MGAPLPTIELTVQDLYLLLELLVLIRELPPGLFQLGDSQPQRLDDRVPLTRLTLARSLL